MVGRHAARSFKRGSGSSRAIPTACRRCSGRAWRRNARWRDGLHGWEDHFIFETVDPETGTRRADGRAGELVITTLTKEALPMIRYRTRDISRLERAPCACGRSHVRIMRITGRSDDMIILRGVNVYPSQIESVLIGFPHVAPYYQLVLEREGALDQLTLEVEVDAATAQRQHPEIARAIRHHVKSLLSLTCRVVIKRPGEVPRSQGKAVRVRDLRPKIAPEA